MAFSNVLQVVQSAVDHSSSAADQSTVISTWTASFMWTLLKVTILPLDDLIHGPSPCRYVALVVPVLAADPARESQDVKADRGQDYPLRPGQEVVVLVQGVSSVSRASDSPHVDWYEDYLEGAESDDMDKVPIEAWVVSEAKACAKPWTVMIQFEHASVASCAMAGSRRLENLARLAVSKLVEMWRVELV